MTNNRQTGEQSGMRLITLLETRMPEIIRQEGNNEKQIHLYATDGCWVAFEKSAYLLCRVCPSGETSIVEHAAYPFPVVIAFISDNELRAYTKKHILRRNELEYKVLTVPAFLSEHYGEWHKREVMGVM